MIAPKKSEGWVKRFCDYMGRHNSVTFLIDGLLRWLGIPPTPPPLMGEGVWPALAPAGLGPQNGVGQVFMAGPATKLGPDKGPAPTTPHAAHKSGSNKNCNHLRYRGMHGTPCKYEHGTLTTCPVGTKAAYYWIYRVPHFGNIYYVDCCGKAPAQRVFCNWTNEINWCLGMAGGLYTCTLALKESEYGKTWSHSLDAGTGLPVYTGVYP